MSHRSLDIYAERARLIADDTVASGRRPIDREAMPAIRAYVLSSLSLGPADVLLDIGAGIGMLTVPLSYFVRHVTVVDHPDVLARMEGRPNIEKLPGDFLTLDLGQRRYSRILAYSMAHYLGSREDVLTLMTKAVGLLVDGGLLLLGDLPNDNYRARTAATVAGQHNIMEIGLRMVASDDERKGIEAVLTEPRDAQFPEFDDDFLLGIVAHARRAGNNAWVVRQPPGLPFQHAREDILIQRLEPGPTRDLFIVQTSDPKNRHMALSMREVCPADCDLIYAWSQDSDVRTASIRTEAFTGEQHREWFARKMDAAAAGDLRWYVLEHAARIPLGVVRYERVRAGRPLWSGGPVAERDGGTEVAIVLAPQARGGGLGPVLLARSEPHARDVLPGPLVALIRPENTASIRAFERAGYVYVGDGERMGVVLRRYERRMEHDSI